MATEILMPRQGNTVESCIILEWKKSVGDTVAAGEPVCEVETDKATFEVEAPEEGTLLAFLFAEGDDVPVLTPIAYVGAEGEEVPKADAPPEAQPSTPDPAAETKEVPTSAPIPVTSRPPSEATTEGKTRISPRARRFATERGIDPTGLTGSGPMGRIIERDVQAYALATPEEKATLVRQSEKLEPDWQSIPSAATEPQNIPVKGIRKIVAERMVASLTTTAQLTMNTSSDARAILAYRKKLKNSDEDLGLTGITLNDIVHYAVLNVLPRFPELNRHFLGDHMLQFEDVDLGFAVDTDRGLMVPVIRAANRRSLKQLAAEANRLAAECLDGSVNPDDLTGGTITVTNLGVLGIESFTPVLNPPQVAILGVCSIEPKPVLVDGEYQFIPHIGLSLTIDHQGVDGAPAARFLAALRDAIANFDLVLAG